MRPIAAFAVPMLLAAALLPGPASAQDLALPRVSQHARIAQTIGTTEIAVDYHRPNVKSRTIWGTLVPWNQPWRTGANEATRFSCSSDVTIEGQTLPAGEYSLLTIPGESSWTVVFSHQTDMWGSNGYDTAKDQLRVNVSAAAAEPSESMQFTFEDVQPDAATLALRWERLRVPVRIGVDVQGQVLAACRTAVAAAKPDDWRTPYRAASWANDAGAAPAETAEWSRRAVAVQENAQTMALMAKVQARAGLHRDATQHMRRAIQLGKAEATPNPDVIAANEKLLAEWSAEMAAAKKKR